MKRIVVVCGATMLGCTMIGGCSAGEEGLLDSTSGGGEECAELPLEGLSSNPEYRHVVTGVAAHPSAPWTSIARGKVDEPASLPGCCDDYVLGAQASSELTVIFGTEASGLVVFDDQPDLTVSASNVAAGVMDVALADLNDDDSNEVLALLSDGTISVRYGRVSAPYFEDGLAVHPASAGAATGRDQLVLGDVDCDGREDILMPSDEGVLIVHDDGSGSPMSFELIPSIEPLDWLTVGDLDHDDDLDIAASSSGGIVQTWIGGCGTYVEGETLGKSLGEGTYEGTRIALGTVCPTFSSSYDIIFSYGDTVDVYCGDGSGSFQGVQELHGTETSFGADFQWSEIPAFASRRYVDIASVGTSAVQEVLAFDIKENVLVVLTPSSCGYSSAAYPITTSFPPSSASTPFSRIIPTPHPSNPSSWERVSLVGGFGLQVIR